MKKIVDINLRLDNMESTLDEERGKDQDISDEDEDDRAEGILRKLKLNFLWEIIIFGLVTFLKKKNLLDLNDLLEGMFGRLL